MAMQPEVRYINAYVSGNVAVQPEKIPQKKSSVRLPKVKKQQKWLIPVDMVAVGGMLVAFVLGIMMIVSLVQMTQAQKEAKMMRQYALSLRQENQVMRDTYTAEFDLNEVQQIAQAMGMVPVEQVAHVQIHLETPQIEEVPTAWENFWAFVVGMFA